jgi:hypothetical protein
MASELTALVPGLGVGALGMLYLSAVGVGAAVLVVADGLGGAVSRELRGQERAQRLALVRASGWGWFGPVFLGVVVFLSILPVPETPVLEFGHPVSGVGYALHCLAAWFTSFGPTRQDFATSRTFWSGFGWLEFSLPRVLIVGPGLLWVVGWILGLAVEGAATRRTVTRVRAVAFGLALVLGLLGVFIAAHQAGYSVRGRYLFPLNMLVCAFAGVWLARGLVARLPALRGCDVFAVFGPVILIHAATLGVLLARYF